MKECFLKKKQGYSLFSKKTSLVQNQTGFSLIEVMIAAFILSVGILGIVGLQAISVKGTHQSFMRHQATHLVQSLAEKMRSNIDATLASDYVVDSDTGYDCTTSVTDCAASSASCSATELAEYDLNRLICGYESSTGLVTGGVKSLLTSGRLEVACQTTGPVATPVSHCDEGLVNIKISWMERALDEATDGSITPDFLQIDTRIAE